MKSMILAFTLVLIGALTMLLACEDDPVTQELPPLVYQPLTTRSAVLSNLEVAYNTRNITECTKVLDQDFTMFFAVGDASSGGTPEQWGRADEVSASTNLLNPSYTDTDPSDGIQPRCTKITLDVRWEDGVTWLEIQPASAPTETWYTTTVFYNFQFDIEPDLHLINNPGAKAQFTVRNAGTEDAPHWQLVEMRDLDGDVVARRSSNATEQSTWGSVKAMYRD